MNRRFSFNPGWLVTVLALLALLAWDHSALDKSLAAAMGGPAEFPLRDNWWLTVVLHDGARRAGWLLALVLCLGVWWPQGPLALLERGERLQLALSTLLSVLLIFVIKSFSRTSCPWDLADFGGLAQHLSHWSSLADGGHGRCFPAGHASTGFAFIGGFFVFRHRHLRTARVFLIGSLGIGFTLGLVQQFRGAHFMSHTLWTAFLCWCVALMTDRLWPVVTQNMASLQESGRS